MTVRTAAAAAGATVLFAVDTALVATRAGVVTGPDGAASRAAARAVHHHGALRVTAEVATQLGNPAAVSAVAGVLAFALLLARRPRTAVAVALARVLTLVAVPLVKAAVDRPRPVTRPAIAHAAGSSFPSGHATGAAVLAVSVVLVVAVHGGRRHRWAAGVLAALMALYALAVAASRVFVVVHWPSDVVGGLLLGTAAAAGAFALLRPGRT